jgi:hypothetical protein
MRYTFEVRAYFNGGSAVYTHCRTIEEAYDTAFFWKVEGADRVQLSPLR